MGTEISVPVAVLHGFLLVLTRVAATFVFAPLPQLRQSPATTRVILSLAVTIALQSAWPVVPVSLNGGLTELWALIERMAAEAAFGVGIGLVVALLTETFTLAAQTLGVQ